MLQNMGATIDGHSRIQSPPMLNASASASRSIDNQLVTSTPFHGGGSLAGRKATTTAASAAGSARRRGPLADRAGGSGRGADSNAARPRHQHSDDDADEGDDELNASTAAADRTSFRDGSNASAKTPGKNTFSSLKNNSLNKSKQLNAAAAAAQSAHCNSKDGGGSCTGCPKHTAAAMLSGGSGGECIDQQHQPQQQQQLLPQQLGKSDRISKEKQKFFRHSAFNSDRVVKTSPPSTNNNVQRTNNNNNNGDNSSGGSGRTASQVRGGGGDDCAGTANADAHHHHHQHHHHHGHSKGGRGMSVSSTSSSSNASGSSSGESGESGEDDEDDDEDGESTSSDSHIHDGQTSSSSSTSSFNDDDSESSSTSNTSSSDGEGDEADCGSKAVKQPTVTAASRKSVAHSVTTRGQNASDANSTWGFAAEAKKNLDIFNSGLLSGRVFGNFDGVDKESLVKVAPTANAKKNAQTKTTGQLRGLFDSLTHVFATSDGSRASRRGTSPDYKIGGRRRVTKVQQQTDTTPTTGKDTRSSFRFFKEQSQTDDVILRSLNNRRADAEELTPLALATPSFLATGPNKKLNSFGLANADADDKPAFSKKFFANPVLANDARPASTSTSTMKTRSENVFQSMTRNRTLAAATSANANSSAAPNQPKTSRRIALVSLPLDQKNLRYNTSSEDEIPYLTTGRKANSQNANAVEQQQPSQSSNNAIKLPSTSHMPFAYNSNSHNKLFGFANANAQSLDFASLRETGGINFAGTASASGNALASPVTPQPPPYNKNQLMGKN